MGDDGHLAEALEREVPCWGSPEAVSRCPNPSHALGLKCSHCIVDRRHPASRAVAGDPALTVKVSAREDVLRKCLALEEVRHDSAVAVTREVVCEQLRN